jgi:hypothetical protein
MATLAEGGIDCSIEYYTTFKKKQKVFKHSCWCKLTALFFPEFAEMSELSFQGWEVSSTFNNQP